MNKKIILFVCKYNRFRSKIAEAFFKKYYPGNEYSVMSSGVLPGHYPLEKNQIIAAKKFGIRLSGRPKPTTTDLLRKIDMMIIVADDVPVDLFNNAHFGRREERWEIRDNTLETKKTAEEVILEIEQHVKKFVRELT
jgi:protein-tyrosine-phosphatase